MGLQHVYQLNVCKKASAQHGHKTVVAICLLKLSTKWMQVVSYTSQPLGRKLEGTRSRQDAMELCPTSNQTGLPQATSPEPCL